MAPELITAIKSIKVSETQTDKLFLIATDLGPHCPLKTIPLHSKSRLGFKEVMLHDCGGMGKQRQSEVRADFSNLDEVAQKYKWDQECIPAEFQDKGSDWTERTGTGEYVLCDKHGRRATVAGTVAPQPQLIYNATEGGQHQIIQGIHKHNCEWVMAHQQAYMQLVKEQPHQQLSSMQQQQVPGQQQTSAVQAPLQKPQQHVASVPQQQGPDQQQASAVPTVQALVQQQPQQFATAPQQHVPVLQQPPKPNNTSLEQFLQHPPEPNSMSLHQFLQQLGMGNTHMQLPPEHQLMQLLQQAQQKIYDTVTQQQYTISHHQLLQPQQQPVQEALPGEVEVEVEEAA
jgi:hypothetical protein